eukprot:m.1664486 g.1664486  ORF g.1664486 m.1664486 type:complete len:60 (+) comp139314_c0_seq1:49-228(+)
MRGWGVVLADIANVTGDPLAHGSWAGVVRGGTTTDLDRAPELHVLAASSPFPTQASASC